jgi:hypothetical protein
MGDYIETVFYIICIFLRNEFKDNEALKILLYIKELNYYYLIW